ncbi:MAG TPA: helix-turn-helix domain-containing protein [Gemmatimonadales bacterium]
MKKQRAPRPGPDAGRIMESLRRIVRSLRVSAAAVERQTGISGAQLFVLTELAARPGRSLGDLVARTLTSQSTVSQVVAGLVDRGLVARSADPADGRRILLEPTAAGAALIRAAPRTAQADLVDGLARISPAARAALAEGLEAWIRAARIGGEEPGMFFEHERTPEAP